MSDRAFFEAWLAAWSDGDSDALLGYYHPEAYYQDPACPEGLIGPEQMGDYFRKLLRAWPGWRWSLQELQPGSEGWTLRWRLDWAESWRRPLAGLDWIEIREDLISRNEVWFDTRHWPERPVLWQREARVVSTEKARLDRSRLLALLRDTYWASELSAAQLEQRIESSVCFGLYQDQELIGFARALTDRHTFAYLADVVIDPAWRGQGLGTWLTSCALEHPGLQPMRRWLLRTRDAHGLYRKLGFAPLRDLGGWLEKWAETERV